MRERKPRQKDWLCERLVHVCGLFVVLSAGVILYFLAAESRYAFDRTFPYGFRFAIEDPELSAGEESILDPNATFLGAHPDGADGIDEKEEGILLPTLEELKGVSPGATGSLRTSGKPRAESLDVYRDDWRAPKKADRVDRYEFLGFATKELQGATMRLRWEPDGGFDPDLAPYAFKLALLSGPNGFNVEPIEFDLRERPSGFVDVPVYVAETDAERTGGYRFELRAEPIEKSTVLATLGQVFRTEWAPANRYPAYGFMPLLLSTLLITAIALLLATPIAIWTSVFLSEQAPPRLREWLKPVLELLASVPTVVLAYFGLMLIAPALVETFGQALRMESGRCLLTSALVMSVLILPTMVSVMEDQLRAVPSAIRDSAHALGLSTTETIRRVLLPAARPGIVAGILLGIARAVAETMIVWILSGGTALMPRLGSPKELAESLVQTTRGIPDTIGIEMANVEFELPHYGHLFLLGLVLFGFTTALNLAGHAVARRRAWQA